MRRIRVLAALVVLAGSVAAPGTAAASPSGRCVYPAQVLDLENWKITVPVDDPAQPGTQPLDVTQPALNTYRLHEWFVPTPACRGVRFRSAVTATTTPNSRYGRSELREMTGGTTPASWSSTTGTHTLTVDESFDRLPADKPHVVGAQIHDADDDLSAFRLEGTDLYLTRGDDPHYRLITANYLLGTRFQAKYVVRGDRINAYYNGTLQASFPAAFAGGYFKAGAYTQANCTNSAPCADRNHGQVTIYRISVTHNQGEPLTNAPNSWPGRR
ncbi:polysaccharide lyase family 7 protein [Amycolatopsis coloradensis]|uniref:Polysaccharide lyase family 7 protein n=1 Tax=Amycolatopsis coloradensis TaxID=76021 RepID=A0A1R0KGI0_9PSEU|nr:polysaccharide lyase family 7 protein [Amycolatopsis coloradensis]OLZ44674.1 polysaccharide lyase family 7 protein [Amycolatopsis coloradensis]